MSVPASREQVKQTIREVADIVQVIGEHVELKRAGVRYTGLCPFHAEKTPSFSVNPQGQFYHCFGCGESGDVFSFVMKYHHLEFPEALKLLARKFHVDLPERQLTDAEQEQLRRRQSLYEANEAAAVVYQQCLVEERHAAPARAYLEQRGVPAAAIERYRLGYAPDPEQGGWSYLLDRLRPRGLDADTLEAAGLAVRKERGGHYDRFRDRIMFPITDLTGRVVAFGGRLLGDGRPKYLNSPESVIFDKSRLLFGLFPHREAIRRQRRALVVEGNFDLLLLAVHGIDNVVAPLGTALTRTHIHSLRSYADEVVLLFDADAAGLKAALRSVPFLLAEQVTGRVAVLPAGHDPDSFVRAEGPAAVTALVESARPLAEFVFDALVREHGLTLAGKSRIVSELKPLVEAAADADQRALMIAHFSEKLGLSPGYFQGGRPGRQPPPPVEEPADGPLPRLAALPRQEQQLVDFLILYPEHLGMLQAAGLGRMRLAPATARIVALLEELATSGPCQPERLLTLPLAEEERAYVVRLLTRPPSYESAAEDDPVRQLGEELATWLRSTLQKHTGAGLQQQILEASRLGQTDRVMELLRLKLESERKRTGF